MKRYCPLGIACFVPAITFCRSPSRCTKVFFRKTFSVTVKRFSVISLLGWNYKTRNPKPIITFAYNWLPLQCSKINKYEDHFSVLFMQYNKSFIDQAGLVKMAGYWPHSLILRFYGRDEVEVHKDAKRELGQYPAILTSRLVNNTYI